MGANQMLSYSEVFSSDTPLSEPKLVEAKKKKARRGERCNARVKCSCTWLRIDGKNVIVLRNVVLGGLSMHLSGLPILILDTEYPP